MRYQSHSGHLARLVARRWCVALLGVAILWCLGLASASTGSASSTSAEATAVTVNWSGTFSSSYEEPYEGGVMTQAINLSWTSTGAFNYQGQQVTPSQTTTLQVNGTMTETDNSPAAPTLQDNCTAQLSAKPNVQYTNLGLMDATVGQNPPDTGLVTASASVPAGPETPSPFIQTNGSGDCATFHMDTTGALPKGDSAIDWLSKYGEETATFNEEQQPSFSAHYGPYSDDQTVGNSTFTAHISDTLKVTTTSCSVGTDTAAPEATLATASCAMCPNADDDKLLKEVDHYTSDISELRKNENAVGRQFQQFVKSVRKGGGSEAQQLSDVRSHDDTYEKQLRDAYEKDLEALKDAEKGWLARAKCPETRSKIEDSVAEAEHVITVRFDTFKEFPELGEKAIKDGCGCGGF